MLIMVLRCFPHALQERVSIFPKIGSRMHSYASFLIHYLHIILLFTAVYSESR
jgi:hypothetical protein